MKLVKKESPVEPVEVIRRPRTLSRREIFHFPGTNYTVFEVGDEEVEIHNTLKDEMMLDVEAIIRAYRQRTKELFGDERARYQTG